MIKKLISAFMFNSIFFWILISVQIFSQSNWFKIASPTKQTLNKLFFTDSLNGWAVGDSGTIINTTNGGKNWTLQNSFVQSNIVSVHFINSKKGFALTWNSISPPYRTIILKTTNGGINWMKEDYPEDDVFLNAVYFIDSLTGFLCGNQGLFLKTYNGGIEWRKANVDSSLSAYFPVLGVKFFNYDFGLGFGGHMDIAGVIWKSTNGGMNWKSVPVGPEPIRDVHFFDSLNSFGIGGDFEYGTGVVKSSDKGLSWNYTSLLTLGIGMKISFRTVKEIWVPLGFAQRFIFSKDTGRTWTEQLIADSVSMNDLIFIDSLNGYSVGEKGVILKFKPSPSDIKNNPSVNVLNENVLLQNYPNPFNSNSIVEYKIAKRGLVTIKVFDMLGKEITTLINKEIDLGNYKVDFNASGLTSGIYFIKLFSSSKIDTKKILLLK